MRCSHLGLALGLPLSNAWLDTGHVLVAQIAKMHLSPQEVRKAERILATWSGDFPGMSDFVNSAVWPDHIKCLRNDTLYCRGLPATALNEPLGSRLSCEPIGEGQAVHRGFRFNAWHFVDVDFTPDTRLMG